jgi:hypothetical protein
MVGFGRDRVWGFSQQVNRDLDFEIFWSEISIPYDALAHQYREYRWSQHGEMAVLKNR